MRSGALWIARGWGAACFLVLPVLLLGSCMLQTDARVSAAPTAEQARDGFREVLDDTETLIGGTWLDRDDPTPRSCAVQWGVAGESYASLRISTSAASAGLADWVQRAWDREGYAVQRTEVGPVTQLVGTSTDGLLIFRESDRGMTLQGESACRERE